MNGTSGFQEVRSSTSRSSTYRLLHEQRHHLGTGARRLLRTHDLIARSIGIRTKREWFLTQFLYLAPFLYLQLNRQPPNLNVDLSNYRANYRVNFGTSRPTIYSSRDALQYPFLHRGNRCSTPEQQEFRYRTRTIYTPGQLLVIFKDGIPESRMNAIHESLNVQVLRKMLSGRVHLVRVDHDRSLNEARKSYLNFPEVQASRLQ